MHGFSRITCFLLLMFFSLESYGGIRLSVHLKDDLNSSEVRASGFELYTLTDSVAKAFGIPRQIVGRGYHGHLWSVIKNWWGRAPDEFVTSDPVINSSARNVPHEWTPYKDAWGLENQVMVERRAVRATILETTGSVESVVTNNIRNQTSREQQGQEVELSYTEEVEDSRYSEKNWALSLTNGIEVNVGGEYAGFSAGATRSIEFTVEHGGSKGMSHTKTKGKTVRLKANVDADPMTIYPVSVVLGKGALKVKIDYEYRLKGYWRALYVHSPYNGSLAAPLSSVEELLRAMKKPVMIKDSEVLEVGFVTDGEISIGQGKSLDANGNVINVEEAKHQTQQNDGGETTFSPDQEFLMELIISAVMELSDIQKDSFITSGDQKMIDVWQSVIDTLEGKPNGMTLSEAETWERTSRGQPWHWRWVSIVAAFKILEGNR